VEGSWDHSDAIILENFISDKQLVTFQEVVNSVKFVKRCGKNLLQYMGLLVCICLCYWKYESSCNIVSY
jgi:hypothetical protein